MVFENNLERSFHKARKSNYSLNEKILKAKTNGPSNRMLTLLNASLNPEEELKNKPDAFGLNWNT